MIESHPKYEFKNKDYHMWYFETLDEKPETVEGLLELWEKRVTTVMGGCPCRWAAGELEICIRELRRVLGKGPLTSEEHARKFFAQFPHVASLEALPGLIKLLDEVKAEEFEKMRR